MSTHKTVSLVLGSGGARGLAHIGVIQELERRGYTISAISGCSMGALVGGIYAAGRLDEFEQWVRAVNKLDILTLLDISWGANGLVKGEKIINTLIDLVGDRQIEDLPMPFTAVATDLSHHKEVWISSGSLFDAIRASISIPLFFTPFEYRGKQLIDGGVLNPVPIAPTFDDHTDLTIAVDVGGPIDPRLEAKQAQLAASRELASAEKTNGISGSINRFLEQLQNGLASKEKNGGETLKAYDVALNSFDAMQSTIARQKLAAYPPDVLIEVPKNACTILEFDRSAELIELGRHLAYECLEKRDRY